jgi:glycolate oxidase iron-sulfur subunit
MKTSFSPEQLADPATKISEGAIRACVHCGFCTATCPTYVLLGDERDSPRGRIWLIKDMLENDAAPTPEVVTHIDRCLSCLACTTTCPSGVDYMHLIDHARAHVEENFERPPAERALRWLLAKVLPYRSRFALAASLARLTRFVPLAGRLAAMRAMALRDRVQSANLKDMPTAGPRKGRVILQAGCAEPILRPQHQEAAGRLLNRHGYDVVRASSEGCCGALVHHLGREADALALVRRNVDLWSQLLEAGDIAAIIVASSGCGVLVKDYGFLMRGEPAYAARAARISALAKDISEFLSVEDVPANNALKLRVALHSACSLQHGQKIITQPRRLLERAGFEVVTPKDAHLCCGSAGTYAILQPAIADQLGERKAAALDTLKPDVIATSNIGCALHIGARTGTPVVHIAELLDWAAGGPKPKLLEPPETEQR